MFLRHLIAVLSFGRITQVKPHKLLNNAELLYVNNHIRNYDDYQMHVQMCNTTTVTARHIGSFAEQGGEVVMHGDQRQRQLDRD
jgi:hypothetical protein